MALSLFVDRRVPHGKNFGSIPMNFIQPRHRSILRGAFGCGRRGGRCRREKKTSSMFDEAGAGSGRAGAMDFIRAGQEGSAAETNRVVNSVEDRQVEAAPAFAQRLLLDATDTADVGTLFQIRVNGNADDADQYGSVRIRSAKIPCVRVIRVPILSRHSKSVLTSADTAWINRQAAEAWRFLFDKTGADAAVRRHCQFIAGSSRRSMSAIVSRVRPVWNWT